MHQEGETVTDDIDLAEASLVRAIEEAASALSSPDCRAEVRMLTGRRLLQATEAWVRILGRGSAAARVWAAIHGLPEARRGPD